MTHGTHHRTRASHGARQTLFCALSAISLIAATPTPHVTPKGLQPGTGSIAFGTAWYPEQWPETRWDADLALMQQAHINTVRIAEFSWSTMEPENGKFDFGWLDRAIAAAARHNIRVVLGTPTAAPPIWLTERYPEVLRVDEDGSHAAHGGRRHFSFTSPTYRSFARRIAGEMAKRYGHNPNVVGWQIDNEVGLPSFDAPALTAWHVFLQNRYGDIASLNRRWATAYWSQTYQRFDQIPLHATGLQNPGLLLDFRHFATATWTSYIANQADAIRALADPQQFLTTNTMFWDGGFDHYVLHEGLDLAAWDNYIQDPTPDWVANGADHDLVRGYKQKNFWLMETQAGRVDWVPVNRALQRGQVRELGWQAVQHGADAVLYWEFRPAPNGQEVNYGTLLAPDGTPAPIFDEIRRLGDELSKSSLLLSGTNPVANVAMLFSYDSRWAIDLQRMHRDFDPIREFTDFYRPFRVQAQGVAVLPTTADLSAYRLVIVPSLNVMTDAEAEHLAAYVQAGGNLVIGPRTGQKDDSNMLREMRQPGPLRQLLGAHVEQFYALDGKVGLNGPLGVGTASIWAEALAVDAPKARILARYENAGGWLDGKPAIVTRTTGNGSITYVGAWLSTEQMAAFARYILRQSDIAPLAPGGGTDLEIGERSGAGKRALIVINHGATSSSYTPPVGAQAVVGEIENGGIEAHSVAVFRLKPA